MEATTYRNRRARNRPRICAALMVVVSAVPTTVFAQLWQDRLVPPQNVPVPALARSEGSRSRETKYPDRLPQHLWQLPVASLTVAPLVLPNERATSRWKRRSVDAPLLAFELHPDRPSTPALSAKPRAYVVSSRASQPPAVERGKSLADIVARPNDDPGGAANYRGLTGPVTTPPAGLAPLDQLRIPEPAPQIQAIRLTVPIPELDGPVVSQERTPPPVIKS